MVRMSTNALNYAKQVPGREGQDAPYVLFNSNAPGEVTLDFHNPGPGLAFFEVRIDGIPSSGTTAHPVVTGDVQHQGRAVPTLTERLGETFTATNYVDVRLALGGERDWDFDWVRFEAQPVPVEATSIPTLSAYGLGFTVLGLSLVAFRWLRVSAKKN